mmetsp:Transcript_164121/g.526311  ORF Transcript_164121/g.526311 Transcript_164121/m.526311 type:complete len:376 (+) Transcript_164121:652-1779(+)
MARVSNQEELAFHRPCGCTHRTQDSGRVRGDLPNQGVQATNVRDRVGIILLAELLTLPAAILGIGERLEGVLGAVVVRVDRAREGPVHVRQRHEHVVTTWPDVQAMAAPASLPHQPALGAEVVGSWVREQHLLVAPRNDVLRECREILCLHGVAHAGASAIARDDRAQHVVAHLLRNPSIRSAREVHCAPDNITARKVRGLAELMVEVELRSVLLGQIDQVFVQLESGDRVVALGIILPVALEEGITIRHVDDAATHPAAQLLQDLLIDAPTQRADGTQTAAGDAEVDGSAQAGDRADVGVALENVHLEALARKHHARQGAHETGPQDDDVLTLARTQSDLLCTGEQRRLVGEGVRGTANCRLRRHGGALCRGVH